MNFGEILRRTLRMVGDNSSVMISADDVLGWANEGQVEVVRRTECLADTFTADVTAGIVAYDLPDDFLDYIRITLDGDKLAKTSVHEIDGINPHRDAGTDQATPRYFYTLGQQVKLYPAPVGSGTLSIEYIRRPVQLVQNSDTPEVPWQMHGDILQYCIAKGHELDSDMSAASSAMSEFERRMSQSVDDATDQHQDSYPSVRALPWDE